MSVGIEALNLNDAFVKGSRHLKNLIALGKVHKPQGFFGFSVEACAILGEANLEGVRACCRVSVTSERHHPRHPPSFLRRYKHLRQEGYRFPAAHREWDCYDYGCSVLFVCFLGLEAEGLRGKT